MAFVTIGLFAWNRQGHGRRDDRDAFATGSFPSALFLCVGVIYDRLHTREIEPVWRTRQHHAGLCAAVHGVHDGKRSGLPGTSGFVGEFMALLGSYQVVEHRRRSLCTTGIILGAAYMLYLYRRVGVRRPIVECRRAAADARSEHAREWAILDPDRGSRYCGWVFIPNSFLASDASSDIGTHPGGADRARHGRRGIRRRHERDCRRSLR